MENKSEVKWILILNIEDLQNPEKIDNEYDRKAILFAMLSSDLLIINSKGDIHIKMIDNLKICCSIYDDLHQFGNKPEIIYTYGQNSIKNKDYSKS